jgi:hypothetical protein
MRTLIYVVKMLYIAQDIATDYRGYDGWTANYHSLSSGFDPD